MTDQTNELRRINWSECFPFTNIFKTFRTAVSPTKLGLALAAIVLTGLAGRILDAVWSKKCLPVRGEIIACVRGDGGEAYRNQAREAGGKRLRDLYKAMGGVAADRVNAVAEKFKSDPNQAVDDALADLRAQYEAATDKLGRGKADREQKARIAFDKNGIAEQLKALRPQGVFEAFLSYETECLYQMLDAARVLNFTNLLVDTVTSGSGGLDDYGPWIERPESVLNLKGAELTEPTVKTGAHEFGVLPSIVLMLRGFQWLASNHCVYAVVFLLISLAIWSLFGGAICRVAALNFAKDERIGAKAALAFAGRKFLGFFAAPLLPILMVAGVAVCLVLGGLFLAIPYVGELFGGLLFGLALLGGFVITLVVLGAIGGFGMMWPTVAVEGSDAFDAVSRSYSYLYSRPWRAAFYAVVATVYGSLCYLFARFFVLVVLKSTHLFIGWGAAGTSRPGVGQMDGTKLDAIWAKPSFDHLYPAIPTFGCEHWDRIGAILIGVWLVLVVMLLCAYLTSFFLSGSTIVYYLLRKEVDATDFSEVFVEGEPDLAAAGSAYEPAPAPAAPQPSPASSEPEKAPGTSPPASPETPAS